MTYPFAPQFVFQEPPEQFNPKVEVAACFINVQGLFLFLRRQPSSTDASTWDIPGGKIEKDESAIKAAVREVKEETDIDLSIDLLQPLHTVFIRYRKVDFVYHMFESSLSRLPHAVTIDPKEHSEYRWLSLYDALELPLIPGGNECIYLSYGITPKVKCV